MQDNKDTIKNNIDEALQILEDKEAYLSNVSAKLTELIKTSGTSVTVDLAELLTNSVNMADKFYNIFLDPDPYYVDLYLYNSEGHLTKVTIPNRAMDKSIANSGEGSPEGEVDAYIGTLYIDTVNKQLYLKRTTTGNTGWVNITPQPIEFYRHEEIIDSTTTSIKLNAPIGLDSTLKVYVNGALISSDKYTHDTHNIYLNEVYEDNSEFCALYLNGLYGIKGETALTLRVGNIRTVNSATLADVRNVGTEKDLILDFDIPKGDTGDSGVWVGDKAPTIDVEHLDDKNIWIDTGAEAISDDEISVSRIFDSGINKSNLAYLKASNIVYTDVDRTKFTEVGTIYITERGIANAYTNNCKIITPVTLGSIKNENWYIAGSDYIDNSSVNKVLFNIPNNLTLTFLKATKTFKINNGTEDAIYDGNAEDIYAIKGEGWYNWKLEVSKTEGSCTLYVSYGEEPLAPVFVGDYALADTDDSRAIEKPIYTSRSNLCKLNVNVRNKYRWTGNRTKYEKVIVDNFEVVGNPTITEAGVLTKITNGTNFIKTGVKANELAGKSWSIKGSFRNTGANYTLFCFTEPDSLINGSTLDNDSKYFTSFVTNDKFSVSIKVGENTYFSNTHQFDFDIEAGKEYFYEIDYDAEQHAYNMVLSHDAFYEDKVDTKQYKPYPESLNPNLYVSNVFPTWELILGSNTNKDSSEVNIYENLNTFVININGQAAYNPTLRIECLVSKDGAKFTFPEHRGLVAEAHDIYGEGNIFVIDDENRTITFPLNDIYSLVEREYTTRVKAGRGLKINERTNVIDNMIEGAEIGDIGESVFVDETIGTRRILNGQIVPKNETTLAFYNYVANLNDSFKVSIDEWNSIVGSTGGCEKFVITDDYVKLPLLNNAKSGYVYYIQIANGVNNVVSIENEYTTITPYTYGMYQYADVDLNSPGWLLSNGSWYSREMYPDFYDWIKANAEGRNRAKWVQPIFSSNTYRAFGGAIYTVSASHASGASQPYRVFNGSLDANNEWWTNHGVTSPENPCWWQMHSTVALVFKKITIMNENTSTANFKTGYVQVSHDGTNWKNVCIMNGIDTPETGAGNPGGLVPITIDWNNTIDSFTTEEINLGFNYLRLYFTASFNASGLSIQLLDIEAEQTYLDKFKKVNNPAYSVTEYDYVINEANYTFRLPLLANACDYSKMRFLVDSQASTAGDHRWFNLYSDGWLEQGGDYTAGNTSNGWSGYITITFPKPFKSNVYNIDFGSHQLRDGNYGTGTELTNILPQSIRIRTYNRCGETRTYKAMGYTNPPAFDTYRHLFPRLYYYVGDTVQSRKHINMAELSKEIAILKQRLDALGG